MGLSFLPITLTNVDIPFDKEVRVSLFDQAVPAKCYILDWGSTDSIFISYIFLVYIGLIGSAIIMLVLLVFYGSELEWSVVYL